MSSWNRQKLTAELQDLLILDYFEIKDTGFSTAEIDLLIDAAPDAPAQPCEDFPEDLEHAPKVTRRGDFWLMGSGIPDPKLEAIFESFAQADTSISRKYGGTGLGLSIIKRLVNTMDGTIIVNSKEGTGSTYTVCVLLKMASEEALEHHSHVLVSRR